MEKYKLTQKWNEHTYKSWETFFNGKRKNDYQYTDKIKNVLEVGSFEGATSMWLCDNVLKSGCTYDIIESFGGSIDKQKITSEDDLNKHYKFYDGVEKNLRHNISHHSNINFRIYKGFSQSILPKLYDLDNKYDLIFIDASHQSDDTFVDGYYCHKMLNKDGLIIFDDYGWTFPKAKFKYEIPKFGIDFFFEMYAHEYLQAGGYQKFGQKK
tara:strand:- start:67 stop:699 length:633 start_codon:yes stop_codon:yes gene_type:complete